jgi:MFS family permease
MRGATIACALATLTLAGTAGYASAQAGQPQAAPGRTAPAQTSAQQPSAARSAADSACVAPSLPLTGSFIFAGLREALADARSWATPPALPPGQATVRAIKLTLGWSAFLLLLGLGVLVFAPEKLRRITESLSEDPGKALLTGLIVDFATLPALAVLIILLAVTLLGILLIPFAIVAFLLIWMGVAALGLFAVAQVLGMAMMGPAQRSMSQRGAALGGLITGLVLLLAPWLAAAAMTWSNMPALVLRGIAVTITVVAVTAGLGAVFRATRSVGAGAYIPPATHTREDLAWQTPTPVGGVVAAKRPAKAH